MYHWADGSIQQETDRKGVAFFQHSLCALSGVGGTGRKQFPDERDMEPYFETDLTNDPVFSRQKAILSFVSIILYRTKDAMFG